jgi:hypothetical protein
MFQHGSSSYLACTAAIPPRFLGLLLDVFVLPLFFCADTAYMFPSWHVKLLSFGATGTPRIGSIRRALHQYVEVL